MALVNSEKPWWDKDPSKGKKEKPELEAKVEGRFLREAKKRGWKCRKLNGVGANDWHDRLVLAPNVICLIEFKRPDGNSKLSPGQEVHHDEVVALGLSSYTLITDSSEEAIAFVEYLCQVNLPPFDQRHIPVPDRFRPKNSLRINTKSKR
jgi:hypothetical protein